MRARRRAAEQPNEAAPFHPLRIAFTAHGQGLQHNGFGGSRQGWLHCGISTRLMIGSGRNPAPSQRSAAPILDSYCSHLQTGSAIGMQATQIHSISRSARSMIDCGIERLSALAVFMLTNISNLVGCSTGRSAGLAPLKILSTYSAARCSMIGRFGP
jgi:hypothetical protein